MLDKTLPYYPIYMKRDLPATFPVYPVAAGYTLCTWQPGMETDWCRIQCSVNHVEDDKAAKDCFLQEFAPYPRQLSQRMLFVCNHSKQPVATACLWWGNTFGQDQMLPRIHWVAVQPNAQGKGLAKALVSALMQKCRELYPALPPAVYLTSQTWSYKAVGMYLSFGFEFCDAQGNVTDKDPAQQIVLEKLQTAKKQGLKE